MGEVGLKVSWGGGLYGKFSVRVLEGHERVWEGKTDDASLWEEIWP